MYYICIILLFLFICVFFNFDFNVIFFTSDFLFFYLRDYFYLSEYFFVYLFLLCFGISLLLIGITLVFSFSSFYIEKVSSYECGFDPFNDSRDPFYIKFYLIALLFVIFDLETIFFLPVSLVFEFFSIYSFYFFCFFLFVLVFSFFYEWVSKVFD